MKKILFAATAAAMLIGCSKDITTDAAIDNGGSDINYYGGIAVEASAGDATRVTVDGDTASATSRMAWEAGDEITIAYDGKTYFYIAQNAGATSAFAPKDAQNAIAAIDPAQEVAAYYNVASVDAATKTAKFDIAAEQHEGEPSNKLPLYAYDASAKYADGKLVLKMNPLASIVEFEVKSSGDWHADALSVAPSARAAFEGYTSIAGAKIDPRTGETDITEATASKSAVKVVFGAAKNFNGSANVQVVVGAARFGGVPETVDGAPAPVYAGGAVVKLYKNGRENFRRTIWKAEEKLVDVSTARKHIYQPLADILAGHKNGISTADDMKAFADEINNAAETFPVGTGFCNEDGVVVLNNDIDLSEYDGWTAIGYDDSDDGKELNGVELCFAGSFDGKGRTVSGLSIVQDAESSPIQYVDAAGNVQIVYSNNAGLFGSIGGDAEIANLTVNGAIVDKYTDPDVKWSYVAGVVGQMYGGTVRNCTSEVAITSGEAGSATQICAGGIVGYTRQNATIDGCVNKGSISIGAVTGQTFAAGISGKVGLSKKGTADGIKIDGCTNYGKISTVTASTGWSYIGGIAAALYGGTNVAESAGYGATITDCANEGIVVIKGETKSKHRGGGIVGLLNRSAVFNSTNNGVIAIDRTSQVSEHIGGIVGFSENSKSAIESCNNFGTVCCARKTTYETGAVTGNIYVSLGGILGSGGGAKTTVDNCIAAGDILMAAADCDHEYRGAVSSTPTNGLIISNCKVGGRIGVVAAGSTTFAADETATFALNETEGDAYNWEKWIIGYNRTPTYSNNSFYAGR